MAKLQVCAVWDSAVQAFNRPIFVPHAQAAVRSFSDEVNRSSEDNTLNKHPDDFELRLLATFDEESGQFGVPEGGTRVLVRAKDVVRKAEV